MHAELEFVDRPDRLVRLITHRVPHGRGIVGALLRVEIARDRHGPAGAHEGGGGDTLARRDVVERAELIVRSPAAGIVEAIEKRLQFLLGRKYSWLRHGVSL